MFLLEDASFTVKCLHVIQPGNTIGKPIIRYFEPILKRHQKSDILGHWPADYARSLTFSSRPNWGAISTSIMDITTIVQQFNKDHGQEERDRERGFILGKERKGKNERMDGYERACGNMSSVTITVMNNSYA